MVKLPKIKPSLKKWITEVLGDLRLMEVALNNKLKELDRLERSENWSVQYKEEMEALKKELNEILVKKEISGRQKLKIQWAKKRDAYSRLFHRLLNTRKN